MQTVIKAGTTAKKINKILKENREVLFKKGTYNLDKMLTVYSNTIVTCEAGVVFNRHHSGRMLQLAVDKDTTKYNGTHDVIWKGGKFVASINTNSAIVIVVCHSQNVVFDGVTIDGCVYLHSFEINSSKNVTIQNCTITNQVPKVGENHKEAIQIDYCYKGGLAITGATAESKCYDDTHCKDITIQNCNFINCPTGIGTHVVSEKEEYHEDIIICHCRFEEIKSRAIRLLGMKNVTILDCNGVILVDRVKKAHTSHGRVKLSEYRENRNVKIDAVTIE